MKCNFCGRNFSRRFLEKHHYPIGRVEGGTETVLVCIDCHNGFHRAKDGFNLLDKYAGQGHRDDFVKEHPQMSFFGRLMGKQPK